MNIRIVPIDQINAAAYNPRVDLQPGDVEYEKLRRSIEEFGYVEPIVWNERTGNMVGGHQRYKIMVNELGHTELQVSVVDLDDQQERLLNIALNKISGRWDDEALGRLLGELQSNGADLVLSGFDTEELDDLIAEFGTIPDIEIEDPVIEDDFNVQGALDNIQVPETQRGDIWQLGPHRLMCGDSTSEADVGFLMDGELADLVVTDPPYSVAIESDSARLAADGRSSIQNDDMLRPFLGTGIAGKAQFGELVYPLKRLNHQRFGKYPAGMLANTFILHRSLLNSWPYQSRTAADLAIPL